MKLRVAGSLVLVVLAMLCLPIAADETAPKTEAPAATAATPPPAPAEVPKPTPAGPLQIKMGDNIVFRFGVLLQPQAEFQEVSAGYAQNLLIRRARFLVGGQVTKNVFFFFETENSRLGNAPAAGTKNMSSGFQTLDAVAEWRFKKALNLSGGLIRVPTSRDALESASSEFTIDTNTYAFTATTALGGTGGRDTGILARGYFLKDKLEYRAALISGMRFAGSRNAFRKTGRVQYNFFDTEVYNLPSYAGANFGNKKIVNIGAAIDSQNDYKGYTADFFADVPTRFGSVLGTIEYQNLDGGTTVPTALAASRIFTADGGLYFKGTKFGTWARYERRDFDKAVTRDESRVLVGVNYYPFGNNFNIKTAYGQLTPAAGPKMNQFVVQLQAFYY